MPENDAVSGKPSMGTPPPPMPVEAPRFGRYQQPSQSRKGVWLAIWIVLAVVLGALAFTAVRSILRGRTEADALASHLHDQMRSKDWDGIYNGSAWAYRSNTTQDESRELFQAISRKIGDVRSCKQLTTRVNVTPTGSYITATFDTVFGDDVHAEEAMVWQSYGTGYRLVSYNINSLALLTR